MVVAKKVLLLFCILFVQTVYGAIYRLRYVPKPSGFENEEGCYVPDLNRVLPYNEPYAPINGKCTQYTCNKGQTVEEDNTVVVSCGVMRAQDGCTLLPADLSQPYPDCCERELTCP